MVSSRDMGTYESDELPHLRLSQKQKDRCRRGNAGAGKKPMLSLEHEGDGDDLFHECVRRGKRHFRQTIGIGRDHMSIYCQ